MYEMKTHRAPFCIVSNKTAQDGNLSFKALGLLTYCLSMPDTWVFKPKVIWKQRQCGRDFVYTGFRELIEKYHCIRITSKNVNNKNLRSGGVSYEIFDDKDLCKARIKELEFCEDHVEHADNFKKCLQRPEMQETAVQYTIKDTRNINIKKEIYKEKEILKIKDTSGANAPEPPTPSISSRNEKKEKAKAHPTTKLYGEYKKIPLSDSGYKELVDLFGETHLLFLIKSIDLHLTSSGKKVKGDFVAYIKKWDLNDKTKYQIKSSTSSEGFIDKVKNKFIDGKYYGGCRCDISHKSISFIPGGAGNNTQYLEFDAKGFEEQFRNILRKLNIKEEV
jgi:hypothetical protein